mmetsp:Transcript_57786/g.122945  ORF Transcript_57786/g.122945 Transcript_57786/m.122945 type:complete len:120 (-) Transcript_57786:76-435(-)
MPHDMRNINACPIGRESKHDREREEKTNNEAKREKEEASKRMIKMANSTPYNTRMQQEKGQNNNRCSKVRAAGHSNVPSKGGLSGWQHHRPSSNENQKEASFLFPSNAPERLCALHWLR